MLTLQTDPDGSRRVCGALIIIFTLLTSDDTRRQQNNGLRMSLRGVFIEKENKGELE